MLLLKCNWRRGKTTRDPVGNSLPEMVVGAVTNRMEAESLHRRKVSSKAAERWGQESMRYCGDKWVSAWSKAGAVSSRIWDRRCGSWRR